MTDTCFDSIYAGVPTKQRDALRRFREQHPEREITVDGMRWHYVTAGSSDETVLLLVGGLRVADAAFRNIPMLSGSFRVITPTYPAAHTMNALADGLVGLLDTEGVQHAHVLAGSFGGMLAQVFVRRHPERVSKLILSTTGILDDASVERYKQTRAMIESLATDVVSEAAAVQMFDMVAPPEDQHAFYRAYLHELYTHRLSKDDILSTYDCLIDYAENIALRPGDLEGWPGQILILESDDDATFDEATRARVRELYPDAQTHVFYGAGHSPATSQRDLYFEVVKRFLQG